MKTNHIVAITVLSLAGSQALAIEPDTIAEERKGAAIGTVVGAIAGGPFGAGVGAMLGGGVFGKLVGLGREHRKLGREMAEVKARHGQTTANMEAEIAHLRQSLDRAESEARAIATVPAVPIQFRTDSSELEAHYRAHLEKVAKLIARRPDVQVQLSGFADRRGSADYNQQLSEARVEEVRQYLMSHGVSARQIASQAFGDSRPLSEEDAPENYFFDRRVVMEFANRDKGSIVGR